MELKTLISNSLSHGRGRNKGKGQSRNRDHERGNGKEDRQGKGNSKGRGRNQSNTNKSRGRGNSQRNQGNAGKRHDGKKSDGEKSPLATIATLRDTSAGSVQSMRIADEAKKQTTTHSSQQLTIEYDLDVLFQNMLYVHSDDEASDDETMEEEVVYHPTHHIYPKKQIIPTQSPLRKPPKSKTEPTRKSRLQKISQHLPLRDKTRPKTRPMRKPPLVTMREKKAWK
jgi:hypothetical protein